MYIEDNFVLLVIILKSGRVRYKFRVSGRSSVRGDPYEIYNLCCRNMNGNKANNRQMKFDVHSDAAYSPGVQVKYDQG